MLKQQANFDNLWEIATPLDFRRKELDQQSNPTYKKILTGYENIRAKISSITEQSKKELLMFSSTKILCNVLNKNNLVNIFKPLIRRDVTIRILTDDIDEYIMNYIDQINDSHRDNEIRFGYSNKLGNFNELIIISDNKHVLQIKYNEANNLEATVSNEEHTVLVQEILFEKY